MIIGKVIGNVWATRKEDRLRGLKFLVIQAAKEGETLVAADVVGAGVGDSVIVTMGSSARTALDKKDCPVDATVVGIIDSLEVEQDLLR